jgi:hypothetical protein
MLHRSLSRFGLNASTAYAASFLSVLLSIAAWFLRGREDQAAGERLAIFVGLWAPTLMSLGNALERAEERSARS